MRSLSPVLETTMSRVPGDQLHAAIVVLVTAACCLRRAPRPRPLRHSITRARRHRADATHATPRSALQGSATRCIFWARRPPTSSALHLNSHRRCGGVVAADTIKLRARARESAVDPGSSAPVSRITMRFEAEPSNGTRTACLLSRHARKATAHSAAYRRNTCTNPGAALFHGFRVRSPAVLGFLAACGGRVFSAMLQT
jgi:hypothetical protein